MGGVRREKTVRRFLIESGAPGQTIRLPEGEAAHARRVLRVKPGDRAVMIDPGGALYEAEFGEVGEAVTARLLSRLPDARPPVSLTLYQGLPKFDKLEFIVQKAAELGAARVVPRPLRDACYRFVAARRYRWFGVRPLCERPPDDLKARFLE